MRQISARTLTWLLRIYPPFLTQGIWVKRFSPDFRKAEVQLFKVLLNRNSNGSIFGGTIFAATDPFYALLLEQLVQRAGLKPIVWLKSAKIEYKKPARTRLHFSIEISDEVLEEALTALRSSGRFIKTLPMQLFDRSGEVVAEVENEVYMRLP